MNDEPDLQTLESISNEEIDNKILEEINKEIEKRNLDSKQIADDMLGLKEIYRQISILLQEQGDDLNVVENDVNIIEVNVNDGVKSLEKAEILSRDKIKTVRDVAIIVGGLSLGGLGFIASPFIGLATLITGTAIGGSIVYTTRKLGK